MDSVHSNVKRIGDQAGKWMADIFISSNVNVKGDDAIFRFAAGLGMALSASLLAAFKNAEKKHGGANTSHKALMSTIEDFGKTCYEIVYQMCEAEAKLRG